MDSGVIEVRRGDYVAQLVENDMSWGVGAINPNVETQGSLLELMGEVLDAIQRVEPSEMSASCCTDGRCPDKLLDNSPVPVREQLVGADIMIGFHIAETLGNDFYDNPAATVHSRLNTVSRFLRENGFGGTHVDCGMANNYKLVLDNIVKFSEIPAFRERTGLFVPNGVYSDAVFDSVVQDLSGRLGRGLYQGYSGEMVVTTARSNFGDRAVASLHDDGRGVHGHVEEGIVRLDRTIVGHAINEGQVYATTGGREVFGVNDSRIERLVKAFCIDTASDEYRRAYLAAEMATNAGHGSLSSGLPTWRVSLAA